MLEHVTMPNKAPWVALKRDDYSRDHIGKGPYSIFPSLLGLIRLHWRPSVVQGASRLELQHVEQTPVDELKTDHV